MPRLPSAERVGVEAASVQGKGGCCRGFFAGLPDARGTGTKGWLQGTMVGRLVTVRRRPGTQSSLCLRRGPSGCSSRAAAFCLRPPRWPINPLLPTAYLARGLGTLPGLGSPWPRRRAGERQAPPAGEAALGPAGCPGPWGEGGSGTGSPAICAALGRAFGGTRAERRAPRTTSRAPASDRHARAQRLETMKSPNCGGEGGALKGCPRCVF